MEKFNIERFNKNRDPRTWTYIFTLADSSIVRQVGPGDEYLQYITHPDNQFEKRSSYYKSGNIKASTNRLYSFLIGNSIKYNEDGTIKETRNWDEPYPFTWEMVVEKIKKEYGVDMTEKDRDINMHQYKNLSRTNNPYPYYTVMFKTKEGRSYLFTLSGINGIMLKTGNEKGEEIIVNDPPQPASKK